MRALIPRLCHLYPLQCCLPGVESPWISIICLHPKAKMGTSRNNLLLVRTQAESCIFRGIPCRSWGKRKKIYQIDFGLYTTSVAYTVAYAFITHAYGVSRQLLCWSWLGLLTCLGVCWLLADLCWSWLWWLGWLGFAPWPSHLVGG